MSFLWPQYLWLMLALPMLPVLYLWLLRRRGKWALRFSTLQVIREASGRQWRRHVPPALLLTACALLLFAVARPLASVTLPWTRSSIMLAMDVSLSMRVTDVKPTRLAAAQEAAKAFLRDVPKNIDVGLVTFAGSAQVVPDRDVGPHRAGQRRSTRSRCRSARPSAVPSCCVLRSCFRTTASVWAT
jgi:Ca-activated chloride channel family protein